MATAKKTTTPKPDMAFNVAKRKAKPITFSLGDDYIYEFTPPKSAVYSIDMLLGEEEITEQTNTRAMFDWLGDGLREGEADKIIARLKDPEDDLDLEHLNEMLRWLQEKVAGRPTT